MYDLILVSQSPRRKQLLSEAGYSFQIGSVKVSEYLEKNVNIDEAIVNCAQSKGQAYVELHKGLISQKILIVSSDTVVVFQENLLGKPKSEEEAEKFLEILSGKMHCVKSAVTIFDMSNGRVVRGIDSTEIQFKSLSQKVIKDYVATGEPMDKAGAYAIQGGAKGFVQSIDGSWSNVVGFPMELFEELVKENAWDIARQESK